MVYYAAGKERLMPAEGGEGTRLFLATAGPLIDFLLGVTYYRDEIPTVPPSVVLSGLAYILRRAPLHDSICVCFPLSLSLSGRHCMIQFVYASPFLSLSLSLTHTHTHTHTHARALYASTRTH